MDDFKNKCYLCEQDELASINIEHRIPHCGDADLKFDWNNLFLACPHCNNIKLAKYGDILDCTCKTDEVEDSIKLKLDSFPMSEVEVVANRMDDRTKQTAELLDAVYNGTTPMKTKEAGNLTSKLDAEIYQFQQQLRRYLEAKKHGDEEEMRSLRRKIGYGLQKTSPFTSFKRWIIRDNPKRNIEFGDLFEVGD